jgi:amino acid permease
MSISRMDRNDWALAGACLTLSGAGIAAVPFVGTRYGDWPEAIALAIALIPLVYISIHMVIRVFSRIKDIEARLDALERGK